MAPKRFGWAPRIARQSPFFYCPDSGQSGVARGVECIFRLEATPSVDMGQPSKAIGPIGVGDYSDRKCFQFFHRR